MTDAQYGNEEGAVCNRFGCGGMIEFSKSENCSCHLGCAPCASCTDIHLRCPACYWAEGDPDPQPDERDIEIERLKRVIQELEHRQAAPVPPPVPEDERMVALAPQFWVMQHRFGRF